MQGDCAEQDYAQAAHWFHLAADKGLAGAQMILASLYESGQGVEKNEETAKYWIAQAGMD